MPWTMFTPHGQRKYLTTSEVDAFIKAANKKTKDVRYFCWMLAYTGCRISEALSMTYESIDFETGHVVVRSLKKRGKLIFRAVPLPRSFLNCIRRWLDSDGRKSSLLWPWSRMTGYRRVCEVMRAAGVEGSYATPKGLRHAFGVRAIQASVPLTLIQRWLGHADIKTTAIYTSAVGPEEREIASRMWSGRETQTNAQPSERPATDSRRASPSDLTSGGFGGGQEGLVIDANEPEVWFGSEVSKSASQGPTRCGETSGEMRNTKKNGDKRMMYCRLIQYWLKCNERNPSNPYTYPSRFGISVKPLGPGWLIDLQQIGLAEHVCHETIEG